MFQLRRLLALISLYLIVGGANLCPAANSCQQNPTPAQSPFNVISPEQYDQLLRAILRDKGYKSQGWGDFHPCNVTPSCGTNTALRLLHPGVDLAAAKDTDVYSPVGGTVISRVDGGDCSSGSCLSYVAVYNSQTNKTYLFLHMRGFFVSVGDTVVAG